MKIKRMKIKQNRLISPDVIAPAIVGLLALLGWELFVRLTNTPPYLLPSPILVLQTLVQDWGILLPSLLVTLQITIVAFLGAAVSGVLISVLFTQSKWIERSFFPYAVLLQTTPIVAVAPLIIIWLKNNTFAALVVCAWIVAFFPIVSNTVLGLNSADHNLLNLFQLYRASRWQTLLYMRLPHALPYFLGGLRISGGLALIGAVVAEFVAGTGGTQLGPGVPNSDGGLQPANSPDVCGPAPDHPDRNLDLCPTDLALQCPAEELARERSGARKLGKRGEEVGSIAIHRSAEPSIAFIPSVVLF